MPVTTGHDVRLGFYHEDNGYAASPNDTTLKPFGANAQMQTFQGGNSLQRIFQPASREAATIIAEQFDGSWSVQFTLTNAWWLQELITTSVTTSGSGAPYTHTYDGESVGSLRLYTYDEKNDYERILKGCIVNSATIQAETENQAQITLTGAYADEETDKSPGSPQAQPTTTYDPMTFAQATLERPSGTTLSLIQQAQLQIQNNNDVIWELGSRIGTNYAPKQRTAQIQYEDIVQGSESTERLYGSSSATQVQESMTNRDTITFVFDNGGSGSSLNRVTFTLAGSIPNEYEVSNLGNPQDTLQGQLTEYVQSISATVENGASTVS